MLLGVDLGQSAVKVTLLSEDAQVLHSASSAYPTSQPARGWFEQNPEDWVVAVGTACQAVVEARQDSSRGAIKAVCLTSATHHAVLLDENDDALRPCILLSDSRSRTEVEKLQVESGDRILALSRNQVSTGWTLPQLRWLASNEPEVMSKLERIVFAKDYVRWRLTGEFSTDSSDAEGSLLFDPVRRVWSGELCAMAPIDTRLLPTVLAPGDLAGVITSGGERLTGIPRGTPVFAGCSDTAAEMFVAGVASGGQGIVKLATAGNVNVAVDVPVPSSQWFTYSHLLPGLSYLSMGTNTAASCWEWVSRLLGGDSSSARWNRSVERMAAGVKPGSDGVTFHPYLRGERAPYFDPDLRGSFTGLAADHGRGHLVRAVLEGVAFSLRDCLDVLHEAGIRITDARILGGGARSRLWRQIVADVLEIQLRLPAMTEACQGAALIAGVGVDVWTSMVEAGEATNGFTYEHEPVASVSAIYSQRFSEYKRVQRLLASHYSA